MFLPTVVYLPFARPGLTKKPSKVPMITATLVGNPQGLVPRIRGSGERGRRAAQRITSLCTTVRKGHIATASCHGYLVATDTSERYYVYSAGIATKPAQPTVTLETVLREANPPLTRLQRFSLAVTVASSFIQLAGTPWLKPRWAKQDVVFVLESSPMLHTHTHTPSLLERLFVGRDFVG